MNLKEHIEEYIQHIKQNTCVYNLQKQGVEFFIQFIDQHKKYKNIEEITLEMLEYFLLVWVPGNKKYLTQDQAYNIVYTVSDLYSYLKDINKEEFPFILDKYGKEYIRLYKSRRYITQLSGDPVLYGDPLVVSIEAYRAYKRKKKDMMSTYEQGLFIIEDISNEGYIGITKLRQEKYYKVLFRPKFLSNFRKGDILHITIKKKIFFMYWELDTVKAYYLSDARQYLGE